MIRTLTFLLLLTSVSVQAQRWVTDVPSQPVVIGTTACEAGIPYAAGTLSRGAHRGSYVGTAIGHTTYDLQTNSADQQRIVVAANGHIATTWVGATILDVNPTDRGTFYQYFDGTDWLPEPQVRLEHVRTGWPSNVITNGKELIIAHDFAVYTQVAISRGTVGSGTWGVETNTGILGAWPRIAANGVSDTVHIINANYNGAGNTFLQYWRSPDLGSSLDITARRLPGIDTASGYTIMAADAYAIDARGDRVAVVAAGMINDLAVWISDDRGDTWDRYRILDFPIDNFDGNGISDTNGDLVADTIVTNDAGHTILIDNTGKVHVWSGRMRVLDETPSDDAWSYFPGTAGLWYWNEDMGQDSVVLLTSVLDLDGSGDLNGIGADIPLYEVSLSGMPSAACDPATGNIYLVYAAMVEFSDYIGDPTDPAAQSFRDLYGMYSDDGGATWYEPINLTNSALDYRENVFPTVAHRANGEVHVQWMRDEEPGTAYGVEPDPAVINEIMYHGFPYTEFEPLAPVCGFSFAPIWGGQFNFSDESLRPGTWHWDFDDLNTSTDQNPYHAFTANGLYDVCLTVENAFGSQICCQAVTVVDVGMDVHSPNTISIMPNPTQDILAVRIPEAEGTSIVTLYSITGQPVLNAQLQRSEEVDLSALPAGLYSISVEHGDGVWHSTVVKQ